MNEIEILAAGAGTGKTHELAELLERAVREEGVRPHAVLATTFTNKAAAELHARVRTRLLASGMGDAAQGLAAARIGTVNAVCGRIVTEAAFELGLSPRLVVLDESAARVALAEAISTVAGDRAAEAARLAERLGSRDEPWNWRQAVFQILDLSRANAIQPESFATCAQRSWDGFAELLEAGQEDAETLDLGLRDALRGFVGGVDRSIDTTAKTATALATAESALRRLEASVPLRWSDWTRLATSGMEAAKKSEPLASPVREAAKLFHRHQRLREDVRHAIELVFAIAADALAAYAEHKRVRGVLDFTDQEVQALRALSMPEPRERLRDELDLVLVDEFQDTSPLQLRIFLELAQLARRSVWVGDQKQAIYGFRGTDPALMDAAIAAILKGDEPRTLADSWRSRPELVRLTSDVFVPPFAAQGLPEARVRLRPKFDEEAAGLGPVVERWNLDAKNKEDDAKATASGVAELLVDETARIRVGKDGSRRPRPGDIAVLCLSNDQCSAVAGALADLGLPAALATSGLLSTPEAQVISAGLALWCDTSDRLALSTLARLCSFPPDGDAWFEAMLDPAWREAFSKLPAAKAVIDARQAMPHAGALAAFDAVLHALDVRDHCLRWGGSAGRLANLEALRAHAVGYVETALASGTGCTPAGLLAWFTGLAAAEEDRRAPLPGEAVHVGTWHGAKGLEWPVTVLADLSKNRGASPLGVQIRSDADEIDLADPLARRWIRYWPQPFDPRQTKHAFATALDGHASMQEAKERRRREDLRLLYVGWTRAKDRVVLADRAGKLASGILALLTAKDGGWLLTDGETPTTWAGRRVELAVRDPVPLEGEIVQPTPGDGCVAAGVREHPLAFVRPSDLTGDGVVVAVHEIGRRLPLNGSPDMADLGSAVHGFLAADRPELRPEERCALGDGLLRRWGVRSALEPERLLQASDNLRGWIAIHSPGAAWRRELPVARRLDDGAVLRGRIDLVLETDASVVVIDHKTFPGDRDAMFKRACGHVAQLDAYARSVRADERRRIELLVHLPIVGTVVEVRPR